MSNEHGKLEAAYCATDYRVDDAPGGPFVIRIGDVCAEVEDDWAFVTACNPRSERLSDAENARRMSELEATVREGGWQYFHGHGVGLDAKWPAEPSLLLVGIQWGDAVALGKQFGQNAVVVGSAGRPARLVWVGH